MTVDELVQRTREAMEGDVPPPAPTDDKLPAGADEEIVRGVARMLGNYPEGAQP